MNIENLEYFDEVDEDFCFVLAKLQKSQLPVSSSLHVFRNCAAERKHTPLLHPKIEPEHDAKNVEIELEHLNKFTCTDVQENTDECIAFIRQRITESLITSVFPKWGLELIDPKSVIRCLSYRDTTDDDGIVEMLFESETHYVYFYLWW